MYDSASTAMPTWSALAKRVAYFACVCLSVVAAAPTQAATFLYQHYRLSELRAGFSQFVTPADGQITSSSYVPGTAQTLATAKTVHSARMIAASPPRGVSMSP
jgi:hypothetical protein